MSGAAPSPSEGSEDDRGTGASDDSRSSGAAASDDSRSIGRSPMGLVGAVLVALGVVVLVIAVAVVGDGSGDGDAPVPTAGPGEAEVVLSEEFGTVEVRIIDGVGDGATHCAWLADDPGTRARGLMGVTDPDLGGRDLMLFSYDEAEPRRFFMRNTPMPLSIAFFGADGELVSRSDMEPCGDSADCPRTASEGDARYAVEVARGGLDDLGITEGARLEVGEEACGS